MAKLRACTAPNLARSVMLSITGVVQSTTSSNSGAQKTVFFFEWNSTCFGIGKKVGGWGEDVLMWFCITNNWLCFFFLFGAWQLLRRLFAMNWLVNGCSRSPDEMARWNGVEHVVILVSLLCVDHLLWVDRLEMSVSSWLRWEQCNFVVSSGRMAHNENTKGVLHIDIIVYDLSHRDI